MNKENEKETTGGINTKLVSAVNELLDKVGLGGKKSGRPKKAGIGEAEEVYTLDQQLKVLDRALKLEALRLKVSEDDEGGGFDD